MLATHVFILLQWDETLTFGLQYEEVLQKDCLLFRLPAVNTRIVVVLVVLQVSMSLAMLINVASRSPDSAAGCVGELGLLAGLAVHDWAVYSMSVARDKWREPQLDNKEIYTFMVKAMPSTDKEPPNLSGERAGKLLVSHYIARSLILVGFILAARITLDTLQLRGELVDYSVNRGKLVYPAGSHAIHNTLLLDQNADSLTLNVELGDFTYGLMIQLEHPLVSDSEDLFLNQSGEQQLSIPAGPLYSRLTLLALGNYVNTTYTVHILRVGEAVTVSLTSTFNTTKYPELAGSLFEEHRRLQYQLQHEVWHVPDVDLSNKAALRINMTSLVFAPMSLGKDVGTALLGEACDCKREEPGRVHNTDEHTVALGRRETRPVPILLVTAVLDPAISTSGFQQSVHPVCRRLPCLLCSLSAGGILQELLCYNMLPKATAWTGQVHTVLLDIQHH